MVQVLLLQVQTEGARNSVIQGITTGDKGGFPMVIPGVQPVAED